VPTAQVDQTVQSPQAGSVLPSRGAKSTATQSREDRSAAASALGKQMIVLLQSRLAGTGIKGLDTSTHDLGLADGPDDRVSIDAGIVGAAGLGSLAVSVLGNHASDPVGGTFQYLQDGSIAYLDQSSGPYGGGASAANVPATLTVTLIRPDCSRIIAVESNTRFHQKPVTPEALMLLNTDQLITLLDSADWDPMVAAANAGQHR